MRFKRNSVFFILITAVFISSFKEKMKEPVQLQNLRCEMLVNPEGIDAAKPRLSWEIISKERNVQQIAYQIIVASSIEKLKNNKADIWNSGKISSDASVNVSYDGRALNSTERFFWKVKVYTNKGESDSSDPAYWSMGLLHRLGLESKMDGARSVISMGQHYKNRTTVGKIFQERFYRKKRN